MYINTLINGLVDLPSIPESIKIESEKILQEFGKDFLINQIKNVDPESLNEINHNDIIQKDNQKTSELLSFENLYNEIQIPNKIIRDVKGIIMQMKI